MMSPDELTPTLDIQGNILAIGDFVRSFDFPFQFRDGRLAGLDARGERANFIEGLLIGIGEDRIDGYWRYRIFVLRMIRAGVEVRNGGPSYIFPPLNGTRGHGGHCFGVMKVPD